MQSFQHETREVDGDSDVAPARVHPGDPNYVMVPVRWLRSHRWMESPGHIIRLQDDVWLVGYSLGHLFGDMMHLCPAEIERDVGGVWPMFVELVANSARGDFTSPSLHRVPDPDTFYTRSSEMTFVGVAVHRRPQSPRTSSASWSWPGSMTCSTSVSDLKRNCRHARHQ